VFGSGNHKRAWIVLQHGSTKGFSPTNAHHTIGDICMNRPVFLLKAYTKIVNVINYYRSIRHTFNACSSSTFENNLNKMLPGYPRNHNYRLVERRALQSFKLYERLRIVSALYPDTLESFLDIGSCKGFFVMDAAQRANCNISVGIDVHESFISVSKKVRDYLNIENARFHLATLNDVSDKPEAYGGPFQTILLIGTYHYLFWGSKFCPNAYYSHKEILSRLNTICSDRIIFSARLEIDRLPRFLKEKARMNGGEANYNKSSFIKKAAEFFHIEEAGYLGKDSLFIMRKA